jgi:hypothetical protein
MAVAYYERMVGEDIDTGVALVTKRNPGGGSLVGTQVGIHTFAVSGASTSATWDPASIAVGGNAVTTVSVPGATPGDYALVSFSIDLQGLTISAQVSAADTVKVVLDNNSGAAVDLGSGTVRVLVLKSR